MTINGKIPIGLSKNQLQDFIRNILSEPDFELTDDQYLDYITPHEDRAVIAQIISPFYNQLESSPSKDSQKKKGELLDLARYLFHNKRYDKCKILECSERPDFILNQENERVGVEVTRLWDELSTSQANSLKKLLERATSLTKQIEPSASGTVNLKIALSVPILDNLTIDQLSKIQKESVAKDISAYALALMRQERPNTLPFVQKAITINNNDFDIILSEDYLPPVLTVPILEKIVDGKDEKVGGYKLAHSLQKMWLLISYSPGFGPSDFKLHNALSSYKNTSKFDKIILNDAFRGNTIEWQKVDY